MTATISLWLKHHWFNVCWFVDVRCVLSEEKPTCWVMMRNSGKKSSLLRWRLCFWLAKTHWLTVRTVPKVQRSPRNGTRPGLSLSESHTMQLSKSMITKRKKPGTETIWDYVNLTQNWHVYVWKCKNSSNALWLTHWTKHVCLHLQSDLWTWAGYAWSRWTVHPALPVWW